MFTSNNLKKITFAAALTAISVATLSMSTLQAHTAADRVKPATSIFYKSQSASDTFTLDKQRGSQGNIEICLQTKNKVTWKKNLYIYAGPERMIKKLTVEGANDRDCTQIQTAEFAPKHARFTLTKAGVGGFETPVIHTGNFSVFAYDGMGFTVNWEKD